MTFLSMVQGAMLAGMEAEVVSAGELKKMENSDHARGLRGFLGGAFASGAANDAVPRLND